MKRLLGHALWCAFSVRGKVELLFFQALEPLSCSAAWPWRNPADQLAEQAWRVRLAAHKERVV